MNFCCTSWAVGCLGRLSVGSSCCCCCCDRGEIVVGVDLTTTASGLFSTTSTSMKRPGLASTTMFSVLFSASPETGFVDCTCVLSWPPPQWAARIWRPSSLAPGNDSGQREQVTEAAITVLGVEEADTSPGSCFISPLKDRFCRKTFVG